jgi:hypothetical protein
VSPILTTLAYAAVLLIALVVAVLLVLGLGRIRQSLGSEGGPPSRPQRRRVTRPTQAAAAS